VEKINIVETQILLTPIYNRNVIFSMIKNISGQQKQKLFMG
jgi:hypothetical protein